jgi:hypothetical protein
MHSLYQAGKDQQAYPKLKNLTNDIGYMDEFRNWFREHNLQRFYIDGNFVLDSVANLEVELQTSINVYTFDSRLELFYRSNYIHDKIVKLVVVPLDCFYDRNKQKPEGLPELQLPITTNLSDGNAPDFITTINIKDLMNAKEAHCCLLNPRVFPNGNYHEALLHARR